MRKFIRQLLNKAGYDLVRINEYTDDKAHRTVKVQVGKYTIDMPGNNVQIGTYKYRPDANNLLGILSVAVAAKYPGMTVLDIGANVGDTLAVIKSNLETPVIGIEGDDTSFRFLEANAKQFSDVTIIKQFLGEKKQTMQVAMEKSGWNTTLIPSSGTGRELTLKTLDEVLEENNLVNRTIKVLKIDCEGFDTIILRGAGELLQRQKPVVFFEYNKTNMNAINEDGLGTLFAMEKFGYSSVIYFDNYGRYMLSTPLSNRELVTQLHGYTEDNVSQVGYYDVCLFHDDDSDIAAKFIAQVAPR